MIHKLIIAAALVALSAPAFADQEHPRLKAEVTVSSGVVRIGDLVAHAGIIANVPIFRAPDLGATGTVSAQAVADAVRPYQLIGLDTGDVSEVVVTRASRTIPAKDIEDRITQALAAQYPLGPAKDITLYFDRELRAAQVDPAAKGEPRVAYLNYDSRSGRFEAMIDLPSGATTRGALRLFGRAAVTTEVATLTRPIDRGEVVRNTDVVIERRPRAEVGRDLLSRVDQVVGLAARTPLHPGQPLRAADLMRPEIVHHNDMVTLVYETPGIRLTMRGKAVDGGAEGDTISVLNEQSKRVVQGVVAGPARVIIHASTPRVAANLPPAR